MLQYLLLFTNVMQAISSHTLHGRLQGDIALDNPRDEELIRADQVSKFYLPSRFIVKPLSELKGQ